MEIRLPTPDPPPDDIISSALVVQLWSDRGHGGPQDSPAVALCPAALLGSDGHLVAKPLGELRYLGLERLDLAGNRVGSYRDKRD